MKKINKAIYTDLDDWKKNDSDASWKKIETKDEALRKANLRESLLKEQGYICCYCGMKIGEIPGDTVIEHFLPKDNNFHPEKELDYKNLLASCHGNGKTSHRGQISPTGERYTNSEWKHCDARKKNKVYNEHFSPANTSYSEKIVCKEDGSLLVKEGPNKEKLEEFIKGISLTSKLLIERRKAAISSYLTPEDLENIDKFKELKKEILKMEDGKYTEYCYYINSALF